MLTEYLTGGFATVSPEQFYRSHDDSAPTPPPSYPYSRTPLLHPLLLSKTLQSGLHSSISSNSSNHVTAAEEHSLWHSTSDLELHSHDPLPDSAI